jgi:glucose/arabinose dehydrogenase/mono/diheme cytochrome c family protein
VGGAFVLALLVSGVTAAIAQPLTRTTLSALNLPAEAPSFGYTTERTLNNLGFNQPIAIVSAPGETNRLFVVEKPGRIMVVNGLDGTPTASVFLDIQSTVIDNGEEGLLALAFHPDYASNGYFYVWYTLNTTTAAGTGRHDRLARFTVSENPNVADPNSEVPLISQYDQASNHNGGDIHFGPDGYLYLSLGDEGGGGDNYQNSQRITKDFFSGLIRIDVDQRPGSLTANPHAAVHAGTYRIPPDNPFVGATTFNGAAVDPDDVRTEFWAIGLRNPFRWSFDSMTGDLWVADVGQDQYEEIDLITKGGNYGWNYREGLHPYTGTPPVGATFVDPIHEYNHGAGNSTTGGFVYRGSQISQLYGAYLFADYGSGRIWALRMDENDNVDVEQLTTDNGIVGFGVNPSNGDILLADIAQGSVRRLVYNSTPSGTPFPATLTDTGAFDSLATLDPAPGFVAYEPNVTFWSDHAIKTRWFGLQGDTETFGYSASDNWTHPAGAVWMKHFELEMTRGDPSSKRRIETRFLVKTASGGYGITYRWNAAQTEATLVAEEGLDEDFVINDGGNMITQTWHYPSRGECLTCHASQAGFARSFNTAQLNRDFDFPGGIANQLTALEQAGYLSGTLPDPSALPALAAADDTSASLEVRVRSYLEANCAQCHRSGGAALGNWDARFSTPTSLAGIIDGALVNNGGDPLNRVIAAGDETHSRMLQRIAGNGATRMPPLATNVRDSAAEQLLSDWIQALAGTQPRGKLVALSARAQVGTGDQILIPGFVVTGPDPQTIMVRAIGPTLADFGVTGPLQSPSLRILDGNTVIESNTGWNNAANEDDIRSTAAAINAFTLPEGSSDSVALVTLDPGLYTAHASGVGNTTGIALIEVYDAEPNSGSSRLTDISVRAQVGAGDDILIPGIVVGPGEPTTVLVRAVGPGLEQFGVSNFLESVTLNLLSGGTSIVSNTGWSTASNAAEIESAAALIDAFPLEAGSGDSAVLVTLNPGNYTLHVSSNTGQGGVALVEVREVP